MNPLCTMHYHGKPLCVTHFICTKNIHYQIFGTLLILLCATCHHTHKEITILSSKMCIGSSETHQKSIMKIFWRIFDKFVTSLHNFIIILTSLFLKLVAFFKTTIFETKLSKLSLNLIISSLTCHDRRVFDEFVTSKWQVSDDFPKSWSVVCSIYVDHSRLLSALCCYTCNLYYSWFSYTPRPILYGYIFRIFNNPIDVCWLCNSVFHCVNDHMLTINWIIMFYSRLFSKLRANLQIPTI